jgi:hypothetical protein
LLGNQKRVGGGSKREVDFEVDDDVKTRTQPRSIETSVEAHSGQTTGCSKN